MNTDIEILPKSRILIHILCLYVNKNIHTIFKSSIYYVNISVTVGVVKNIFIPKLLQDFDIKLRLFKYLLFTI